MDTKKITEHITALMQQYSPLHAIVQAIAQHNGRALLVGGAVRDLLLGLPIKDLDVEVHGIEAAQLEVILKQFGSVSFMGKSFGVLRIHGLDIDWSLPRADSAGRKPAVAIDPYMSLAQAFRRRDLTINAMGIDLISYELIDPFNGKDDLEHKILRATDPHFFVEDPLRFYRVMQFVSRFAMTPDDTLNKLCTTMDVRDVSRERIEVEFEKMFLKSERPSLGLRWIHAIGRLPGLFPELAALVTTPQELKWHPEGDVFEHAMQALDAAAHLTYIDNKEKLTVLYAALCHDVGKATTTRLVDGVLRSFEHPNAGVPIARNLLRRITRATELIDAVCKLVKYHMVPVQFIAVHAKSAAYKRLASKVAPQATLRMLALLAYADKRGRNAQSSIPLAHSSSDNEIDQFLAKAEQLRVDLHPEQPLLHGRDIMDVVAPGPRMGQLLAYAYKLQIEENITDKEILRQELLKKL